jgi:hypothetical protein
MRRAEKHRAISQRTRDEVNCLGRLEQVACRRGPVTRSVRPSSASRLDVMRGLLYRYCIYSMFVRYYGAKS